MLITHAWWGKAGHGIIGQMPREQMSFDQSVRHLREQVEMLTLACMDFDAGRQLAHKWIAVAVRVLMHQTPASHALLSQLGIRDSMLWFDQAHHSDDSVSVSETLVMFQFTRTETGSDGTYVPYLTRPDRPAVPSSSFETWWKAPILAHSSVEGRWSRSDVVLKIANQDGGAHVDPRPHAALEEFKRQGTIIVQGPNWVGDRSVLTYMLRAIGHEVLVSLDRARPDLVDWPARPEYRYVETNSSLTEE